MWVALGETMQSVIGDGQALFGRLGDANNKRPTDQDRALLNITSEINTCCGLSKDVANVWWLVAERARVMERTGPRWGRRPSVGEIMNEEVEELARARRRRSEREK